MASMREKAAKNLKIGDQFSITRTFTEQDVIDFSKISRDYNPVHFDERFAETKRFNGRICHGLLVGGMITQIGGQLGWLATEMNFEFIKPIYFGDRIQCTLTIRDINTKGYAEADAIFTGPDQTTVLKAVVKGFIPGEPEKEVLSKMIEEGDPTNELRGFTPIGVLE